MATNQEETFTVTRITRHIPKSYTEVIKKLESSIKVSDSPFSILEPTALRSKDTFEEHTNARLGPHGFMQFLQMKHGAWMGL